MRHIAFGCATLILMKCTSGSGQRLDDSEWRKIGSDEAVRKTRKRTRPATCVFVENRNVWQRLWQRQTDEVGDTQNNKPNSELKKEGKSVATKIRASHYHWHSVSSDVRSGIGGILCSRFGVDRHQTMHALTHTDCCAIIMAKTKNKMSECFAGSVSSVRDVAMILPSVSTSMVQKCNKSDVCARALRLCGSWITERKRT